jgi:hypothetical protein
MLTFCPRVRINHLSHGAFDRSALHLGKGDFPNGLMMNTNATAAATIPTPIKTFVLVERLLPLVLICAASSYFILLFLINTIKLVQK